MMSQTIKINYHYRLQLEPILDISNRAQEDGHSYTKKKNFEKTQKTKKNNENSKPSLIPCFVSQTIRMFSPGPGVKFFNRIHRKQTLKLNLNKQYS